MIDEIHVGSDAGFVHVWTKPCLEMGEIFHRLWQHYTLWMDSLEIQFII